MHGHKPLSAAQYAALLESYVDLLGAKIAEVSPSPGWPVASLRESYLGAEVSQSLSQVWHSAMIDIALAGLERAAAVDYAEQKIAHHYL